MSSALFRGRRVLWMPFAAEWQPPSSDVRLCCEGMQAALAFDCEQHADPFACADALVVYNEILDEYGIPVHDGGPSYVLITHCPWCGAILPEGQRDRWFDETEALGLASDASLPAKYLTRAWRTQG
ncbi:DUF6980 family protein [Hyphomicrobium album]|nr:hypothetical protein [Hyphomicrobium album]